MTRGVLDVPVVIDLRDALEGYALAQLVQMDTKSLNLLGELAMAVASRELQRAIGEAPKSRRQTATIHEPSLENVERVVGLDAARGDTVDLVDGLLCRHAGPLGYTASCGVRSRLKRR